jgi:hypothetical protein
MSADDRFDPDIFAALHPLLDAALTRFLATGRGPSAFVRFARLRFGAAVVPYLKAYLRDALARVPDPDQRPARAPLPPDLRRRMVAEAAYYRAEARSFAQGHALEDWLAAEAEVDRRLGG